jgi:hypothetical protein
VINIKELTRPPDYEIRANIFIHHVRGVGMQIERKYGYLDIFQLTVEKALEEWGKRFDALSKISNFMDTTALGEIAPSVLADHLDQESASSCEVEIYVSCTSYKPVTEFINAILELAKKQTGNINDNFMPMLSTEDRKDMIKRLDSEAGESRFITHLFFTFK